ncbi:hypothetical protein HJD18_13475 [Thermoleophilia bacterium SCSIO 60948]|nr:hypothetical protein HJD18_13475 [Thermoleophilia bacterium SCSIO 60948]
MEQRTERIVIETGRHRIVGDLALPRDGHRSRLSDFLNSGTPDFISLTDAEIRTGDGEPERLAYVAVAVGQILIAHPLGDG